MARFYFATYTAVAVKQPAKRLFPTLQREAGLDGRKATAEKTEYVPPHQPVWLQ